MRAMNDKKHTLKEVKLYEENGLYYLRIKYILEDDHRIEELDIPKAVIQLDSRYTPCINYVSDERGPSYIPYERCSLETGIMSLELRPGETSEANHVFYTCKTIKEKPQELTLSEIEKKLGYKVKIVSEKNNAD